MTTKQLADPVHKRFLPVLRWFHSRFHGNRGHGHIFKAAGVYLGKGREIRADIQGQTMDGNAAFDGNADAADFFSAHPEAVVLRITVCDNAKI